MLRKNNFLKVNQVYTSPTRKITIFDKKTHQYQFQKDQSETKIQRIILKSPQRNKSCECNQCGCWKIKLSDKEQIIQNNYIVTIKRRKRLHTIFINCVNTIIQVNRFKMCGMEHFFNRMQRKLQKTKTLQKLENQQIQMIQSLYHINLGNIIIEQPQTQMDPQGIKHTKKILFKVHKEKRIQSKDQKEHIIDLSKYTSRSRSNNTINKYIENRLAAVQLPPLYSPNNSLRESKQYKIVSRSISTYRKH